MEEASNNNESPYISSVLPGWFSEISPLWPGSSLYFFLYASTLFYLCYAFRIRPKDKLIYDKFLQN